MSSTQLIDAEEIESVELAYHLALEDRRLSLDARLFYNSLDNLVSERLGFLSATATNNGESTLKGFEFQADYKLNGSIALGMTYAYVDSDANNFFEEVLYSKENGSAYAIWDLSRHWQISTAYYGASSLGGRPFDKFEGTVKYRIDQSGYIDVKVSNATRDNEFIIDQTFSIQNNNHQGTTISVGMNLEF